MDIGTEILKKPYARQIVPEEDGSFRGEILEFPGCIALGDTRSKALSSLERAAKNWIEAALENGQAIPEPFEMNEEYSGKLVLRLPKSLHKKAAYIASREGVSLNQFIVSAIAMQVGEANAWSSRQVKPAVDTALLPQIIVLAVGAGSHSPFYRLAASFDQIAVQANANHFVPLTGTGAVVVGKPLEY